MQPLKPLRFIYRPRNLAAELGLSVGRESQLVAGVRRMRGMGSDGGRPKY